MVTYTLILSAVKLALFLLVTGTALLSLQKISSRFQRK